jgi:CheY-like chemotaxis protein/DNA-binding XRE family transcriptional regulator
VTQLSHAFGKALKEVRKARGLTQEDFSLVTSRTYLSSLERGHKSPTLRKVEDIARAIGVHPLSLLTCTWLHAEAASPLETLMDRIKTEVAVSQAPHASLPIRLLISDDHTMMREGIKRLYALTHDIMVVDEARNGAETLERLQTGGVDLLLLDLSMPGLSGKELISTVRARYPALPILVLSMHAEPGVAQSALEAGACGYLTKDQDPDVLLSATRITAQGGRFIDPKLAGHVAF